MENWSDVKHMQAQAQRTTEDRGNFLCALRVLSEMSMFVFIIDKISFLDLNWDMF